MRGLDLFALPSLTEGTPNSLVEAMSHGLPVVASAVGGVPDLVTPEVGALVQPGDAASLADKLVTLAADAGLRARMGRAAEWRYAELFLPDVVLPMLLETYERAASKKARRAPPLLDGCRHPGRCRSATASEGSLRRRSARTYDTCPVRLMPARGRARGRLNG